MNAPEEAIAQDPAEPGPACQEPLSDLLDDLRPRAPDAGGAGRGGGEVDDEVGPDGVPVETDASPFVSEADDEALDDGDERLRPVKEAIGAELVHVVPARDGWDVADRRGGSLVDDAHIRALSPIVREIARGRIGQLAKAAGVVRGNPEAFIEKAIVGAPVLCELIEPGDGAGEVLIAAAAVATEQLAGRTAALLNAELARGDASMSTRRARDLGGLLRSLNGSTANSATALCRLRALKRRWDAEVKVLVRQPRDVKQFDAEPEHDEPRADH